MTIYEKLLNIQTSLKAPKSQKNDFGNYNYRSCEDILEAVKPFLKKEKCVLVINDEVQKIENRYYLKAVVNLIDVENGESITASAFAREEETKKKMDGSQITGASSSYARKYALNGLFAIDDTKDSDATNQHDKKQVSASQQSIIKQQIAEILKVKGISFDKLTEVIKVKFKKQKFDELTANEQQKLLNEVRAW
ncbi:recombinase [Finegoldia sp. BIOML-A3]|uniref:ERF family protein n=1 Tax=unclassified Finegoldia TaxID=2619637 RepID=UPI0012B0C832|nr:MULTISPECIES: ERF family protein [unclassified Finegoldia]MSA99650.1 recombinase [Finegoldia sp. BIOML-A3]MSB93636.1 recombinase [Finegoldia sp. BIOML-A4]